MARRRKKTTTRRRRTYRVRRPTTRKGMKRRTARRAYVGTAQARRARARRRRNPTGFTQTPAFRYGATAVAGAVAGAFVDKMAVENPEGILGKLSIPLGEGRPPLSPAVTASVIGLVLANWFVKKAATRGMIVSASLGMLAPAAIRQVTALTTSTTAPAALTTRAMGQIRAPRTARRAPQAAQYFTQDLIPA